MATSTPAAIRKVSTLAVAKVERLGTTVDVSRWDVMIGRALLDVSAWLLEQPDEVVQNFLPALAIAAARESQYKAAAKRERAAAVLAQLAPYVERSAWVADLIARSGCHFVRVHEATAEAAVLYELAKRCKAIAKTEYLRALASSVRRPG